MPTKRNIHESMDLLERLWFETFVQTDPKCAIRQLLADVRQLGKDKGEDFRNPLFEEVEALFANDRIREVYGHHEIDRRLYEEVVQEFSTRGE